MAPQTDLTTRAAHHGGTQLHSSRTTTRLTRRVIDGTQELADALTPLIDHAEAQADPTLSMWGAVVRGRLSALLGDVERLAERTPQVPSGAEFIDLRAPIRAAVEAAIAEHGDMSVNLDLPDDVVPVCATRESIERAVTRALLALHSGERPASVYVRIVAAWDEAELKIVATGSTIGVREVGHVMSQLTAAVGEDAATSSHLKVRDGEIVAMSVRAGIRAAADIVSMAAVWELDLG